MKSTTSYLAALALLLTSFSSQGQENTQPLETRLYAFDRCPVTGPRDPIVPGGIAPLLAPILSIVISHAVGVVVDKAAKAVADAAKDKDFPLPPPADLHADFYAIEAGGDITLNPQVNCVVLVRGKFVSLPGKPLVNADAASPIPARIMNRFQLGIPGASVGMAKPGISPPRLQLSEPPTYYAEFAVVSSQDKKKIGMRPQLFFVNDFQSNDGFFGPHQREYSTTLAFVDPATEQAFLSVAFKFSGVERGTAKIACNGKMPSDECNADELGGIKGMFPTMDSTAESAAEIRKRQQFARSVAVATSALKLPDDVSSPLDDDVVKHALRTYCDAIIKANNTKGIKEPLADQSCPLEVNAAKRNLDKTLAIAEAKLEKDTSERMFSESCKKKVTGDVIQDRKVGVECIQNRFSTQTANPFIIRAAVTETRPGNAVAKFFSPIIEEGAPDIKSAIVKQLDPTERRKTAEAKAEKQATAESDRRARQLALDKAVGQLTTAEIDYQEALRKRQVDDKPDTRRDVVEKWIVVQEKRAALSTAQIAAGDVGVVRNPLEDS